MKCSQCGSRFPVKGEVVNWEDMCGIEYKSVINTIGSRIIRCEDKCTFRVADLKWNHKKQCWEQKVG